MNVFYDKRWKGFDKYMTVWQKASNIIIKKI